MKNPVYRHKRTGDVGHMEEEGGRKVIRRSDGQISLKVDDWLCDDTERKMTRGQVMAVALAADIQHIALLAYRTPRNIHDVTQEEKVAFLEKGPLAMKDKSGAAARQEIYEAIMEIMMRIYG